MGEQSLDGSLEILIDSIWKMIKEGVETLATDRGGISFQDKKEFFRNNFLKMYHKISTGYMAHPDSPLDRHKIAAIIMVAIIKSNILESNGANKSNAGKRYLGKYVLAVDCGLEYMRTEINIRLEEKSIVPLDGFYFPEATACKTDYYKIFYRNLYFADQSDEWHLNPLDIAERLFLLEYITLEQNNIDPSIMKEY